MSVYVEIGATKQIKTALEYAAALDFPMCITSKPGMGKSTTLRNECEKHGFAYVEADQTMNRIQGFYKGILAAYDRYTEKSQATELNTILKAVIENKRHWDRNPLLVVDEFQTLSVTLQRQLLYIQETNKLPMLLSGNPERIASTKQDQHALEQVRSRIGCPIEIFPPTEKDCEAIGIAYKLEGIETYNALKTFGAGKSVREICRLLKQARALHPEGTLQLRHLELAARLVYGTNFKFKAKK